PTCVEGARSGDSDTSPARSDRTAGDRRPDLRRSAAAGLGHPARDPAHRRRRLVRGDATGPLSHLVAAESGRAHAGRPLWTALPGTGPGRVAYRYTAIPRPAVAPRRGDRPYPSDLRTSPPGHGGADTAGAARSDHIGR